jgi:hypothetical protein
MEEMPRQALTIPDDRVDNDSYIEARFGIPEPMAQAAWNCLPREMRPVLVRTHEAAQPPASKDQPG